MLLESQRYFLYIYKYSKVEEETNLKFTIYHFPNVSDRVLFKLYYEMPFSMELLQKENSKSESNRIQRDRTWLWMEIHTHTKKIMTHLFQKFYKTSFLESPLQWRAEMLQVQLRIFLDHLQFTLQPFMVYISIDIISCGYQVKTLTSIIKQLTSTNTEVKCVT